MKTKLTLFSSLLFIFFLEIIIASPGNAVIKIMPLGDSITVGNLSGADPDDNDHHIAFRAELWDQLVAAGYDVNGLEFVGSMQSGGAVLADPNHEGHIGWWAYEIRENIYNWLVANPADIILLHIGTNDIISSQDPADIVFEVNGILDEIDRYSVDIPVILALIINQWNYICDDPSPTTTFNNDLNDMAETRKQFGDIIEIVDMECGADIDYRVQPAGDMYIDVHPFETGYNKMADAWYTAIFLITHPVADAGPNQSVEEGDMVTLDASNSVDPDGMIDSYFWEQMPGGPQVVLSDPEAMNPTFTAPDVGLGVETLTFQVTITDDELLESTDTTNVYVSSGIGDELAADFGASGLWHYDGTTWSRLTTWDAGSGGMAGWTGGLAVDFEGNGLWNFDGTAWSKKSSWNPDYDLSGWFGGLAVDFGANGLWNYDGTTWTRKTTWNAGSGGMAGWTGGLAVDFDGDGLWNYDGTTWSRLTIWNPDTDIAGWTGGLAVDFAANGLWNYNGTTWSRLTIWNPGSGGTAGWTGGLAVDFDGNGLWNFDGTTWSRLMSWDPEGISTLGDGLAVDFGANGVWYYDGSAWSKKTSWNAENLTDVDLY